MASAPKFQLLIDFSDPAGNPEKQNQQTESLFAQLGEIDGVKVDRVVDPNPQAGSRSIGGFLWGILTTEITWEMVQPVLGRVLDVVSGKNKTPIKLKVKQLPNGQIEDLDLEVHDRKDLEAVSDFLQRLAEAGPAQIAATLEPPSTLAPTEEPKQLSAGE